MEINTPEQFMQAVNRALICMDTKQRIAFVRWIKQRTNQYNFNYPQGYKEPANESNNTEQPINNPVSSVTDADKSNAIDATVVENTANSVQ